MELIDKILQTYPELQNNQYSEFGSQGSIILQDDSDGVGAYIKKWEYSKPIPEGLKLGK